MAHNEMSAKQLEKQIKQLQAQLEAIKSREAALATLQADLDNFMQEKGLEKSDILELLTGKKTKPKTAAKYRHPENEEVTWNGRGRKPQWFLDALEAGLTPEMMSL